MRLRDLGEAEVLRRLIRARGAAPAGVPVDAGDDAAVLPASSGQLIATTDAFVEGRHWRPEWLAAGSFTHEDLGARLAAANLSDIAAMGGAPRWALLSLGARPEQPIEDLEALQRGVAQALAACGAHIVGGNIAAVTGEAWASLALLGEAVAGRVWTRAGARAGDLLAVTGSPGRAAAWVILAARGLPAPEAIDAAFRRPTPRVAFARALADAGVVTAAIDLSDGFGADLARLAAASGVGVDLEQAWPADEALAAAAATLVTPVDPLRLAPGDDYELLLAVDPGGRAACERIAVDTGTPLAFVGRVSSAPGLRAGGSALAPRGYDHFATADGASDTNS